MARPSARLALEKRLLATVRVDIFELAREFNMTRPEVRKMLLQVGFEPGPSLFGGEWRRREPLVSSRPFDPYV